jgi:hypothetical protein
MEWEQPAEPQKKKGMHPAQAGSVLLLVLTVMVLLCYAVIFVNPYVPFNIFAPERADMPTATAAAAAEMATSTPVPTSTPVEPFPPTWTPTWTPTATSTRPPLPTRTPTFTPGPVPMFSVPCKPIFTSQDLYPEAADWWSGVAGEVSTATGKPVTNATIRIWDDEGHAWETKPGDAQAYSKVYGAAHCANGTYTWWEQFLDRSCKESFTVHVQASSGGYKSRIVTFNTCGFWRGGLVVFFFQEFFWSIRQGQEHPRAQAWNARAT